MQRKDPGGPPGACSTHAGRNLRRLAALVALGMAFELGRSMTPAPVAHPVSVTTPATRDARALELQLEQLEAKLHQGMAWTQHQEELARRHEQISAITCEAAVSHAQSAERLAQRAARRSVRQAARKTDTHPPPGQSESSAAPEPAVHQTGSPAERPG